MKEKSPDKHINCPKADPDNNNNYRFKRRESPLTTLYNTPSGRVLYSVVLNFVFVVFLIECARYIIRPDILHGDLAFIGRCFTPFSTFLAAWIPMHAAIIGILYPAAKVASQLSSRLPFIMSVLACLLVIGMTPILVLIKLESSEVIRNMIVMEQVRIFMKVIAYSVEICREEQKDDVAPPTPAVKAPEANNNNLSDVQKKAEAFGGSKVGNRKSQTAETLAQERAPKLQANPLSLKSLVYFLFAPTLLYRPSYPSLGRPRSYAMIAKCIFDSNMLMFLVLVCHRRYLEPLVSQIGTYPLSQMPAETILSIVIWSIVIGWLSLMGIGFGFLHCWLNIWAEILDFGDRQFYKPWWECYGIDEFMRTWNFLIHSWISSYLFKPLLSLTKSKQISLLVVILVSAFIHDYIMSVVAGVATSIFATVVVFVVIPTLVFAAPANYLQRARKGNFFTWFVLTMTGAVMGLMGGMEYFTRIFNCVDPSRSVFNLKPGIFDCKF